MIELDQRGDPKWAKNRWDDLRELPLIDSLELEKHVENDICWYLIKMVLQSSSIGAIL